MSVPTQTNSDAELHSTEETKLEEQGVTKSKTSVSSWTTRGQIPDYHRSRTSRERKTGRYSLTEEQFLQMHYLYQTKKDAVTVKCELAYKLVESMPFNIYVHSMIVLSAIQLGLAANHRGEPWESWWDRCEFFFTATFVLEMVLKQVAIGIDYFRHGWNLLDFVVCMASIVDSWILPWFVEPPGIFKILRLIRLLRILKMLKVIRKLRLVVEGLVSSMSSMLWVFLLLGGILYAVGIYCVDVVGSESAGYPGHNEAMTEEEDYFDSFNSYLYFGSVSRSMLSLFGMILLAEWSVMIRPIWERQPEVIVLFVGLVVLTTFGVLNVIIGVVVERTMTSMTQLREEDIALKKEQQTSSFRTISDILYDLDVNSDGSISRKEMEAGSSNQGLLSLLEEINFPHGFTFGEFHSMLDLDGSGHLNKNEFISGMLRLVYNDEFQRDCMFQLSMGQIKANQHKLHAQTQEFIKNELKQLRLDLGLRESSRKNKGNSESSQEESSQAPHRVMVQQSPLLKPVNDFLDALQSGDSLSEGPSVHEQIKLFEQSHRNCNIAIVDLTKSLDKLATTIEASAYTQLRKVKIDSDRQGHRRQINLDQLLVADTESRAQNDQHPQKHTDALEAIGLSFDSPSEGRGDCQDRLTNEKSC